MNWKNLIVSTFDGHCCGNLGDYMSPEKNKNLSSMEVDDGKISRWEGYFISAPSEIPESNTPRWSIDWTGFQDAYDTHPYNN